ncbi:hypothetical protein THAOC_30625, partial [Thalassiosira oceanica]
MLSKSSILPPCLRRTGPLALRARSAVPLAVRFFSHVLPLAGLSAVLAPAG